MEITNPSKKYRSSDSWVYSCQYHIVFCTKYSRPVLCDGIDERFKELVLEKQDEFGYKVLEMETMPNHVHLLLDVDPNFGIAKVIARIKGFTASQLRKEYPSLKSRLPAMWTRNKFISTVGSVNLQVIKQYIIDQKGV